MRVAAAVGISQGMVSKHVTTKPAEVEPLVARLADEFMHDLESNPRTGTSPWCVTLSVADGRSGGQEALDDVLAAERMLRTAMPLRFLPQIGLNVARALPDAQSPEEVLSYPGRLVDAGGALIAPAPPAFGASGHLARCLLHVRKREPAFQAIANVKGGAATVKAAKRLGWRVVEIAADRRGDTEAPFRRAIDAQRATPSVLHDGDAPGIEPCLYIIGRSAVDVAQEILGLDRER